MHVRFANGSALYSPAAMLFRCNAENCFATGNNESSVYSFPTTVEENIEKKRANGATSARILVS